ncbi:MAG: hydrogenase maturation nickel metallochaperone HypA [Desulfuromonas sp.]|nr:MAG: hydrogenase maturation nickel metallochaperone HypA [Desulfuromonas sp.]
MHEFSVVSALLDLVTEDARKHKATGVTTITVKVGVMSGIEPELFEEAFHVCKRGTVAETAALELIRQPIEISCPCGYQGGIEGFSFRCPKCGETTIRVSDGEDMILQRLELELPD